MSLNNNTYATKKTIAQVQQFPPTQFCTLPCCDLFSIFKQGMLDIALLTANASQLRYILQVFSIVIFDNQVYDALNHLRLALITMTSTHQCWSCLYPACHSRWISTLWLHSITFSLKALNGLAQLIMGPLDIDKDEHKSFLNVVILQFWFEKIAH